MNLIKCNNIFFRHGFTRINTVNKRMDSCFRRNDKLYHFSVISLILQVVFLSVAGVGVAAAKTDSPVKECVKEITKGQYRYQINVGGTLDEFNTAQYIETYDKNMRLESKFQPNRYLIIENTGETDVVNPRIIINGRRNWFSADDILDSIFKPGMGDGEKAMAIYAFLASHEVQGHENDRRPGPEVPEDWSNPSRNQFKERADPVKAVNFYYCGGCQYEASNFVILCRQAGLPARATWLNKLNEYGSHCVAEAWYDNDWHLFDADQRTFYLDSDSTNIASFKRLHENPSLISRGHAGGFASKGLKDRSNQYKTIYPPHIMPVENWLHTMAMTLRPGEKITYRWDNIGKYRCGDNRRNIKPKSPEGLPPYQFANGRIIYQPRLAPAEVYQKGIVSELNIEAVKTEGGGAALQPQVAGFPAFMIYRVDSPYPIVGGLVSAKFSKKSAEDSCKIYVSVHDSNWVEVCSTKPLGENITEANLDDVLNPKPTSAIYNYYVKFEMQTKNAPADVGMAQLCIESDVQLATTSLPALSAGINNAVYSDESKQSRRVKITHGWTESSAAKPPLAPAKAVLPNDGGTVSVATPAKLSWQDAKDPDGSIADYHIQVSARPDMLVPISCNFDLITGSSKPEWDVPQGWLVKDRTYYWRVRARDNNGVWSNWSKIWKFRTQE